MKRLWKFPFLISNLKIKSNKKSLRYFKVHVFFFFYLWTQVQITVIFLPPPPPPKRKKNYPSAIRRVWSFLKGRNRPKSTVWREGEGGGPTEISTVIYWHRDQPLYKVVKGVWGLQLALDTTIIKKKKKKKSVFSKFVFLFFFFFKRWNLLFYSSHPHPPPLEPPRFSWSMCIPLILAGGWCRKSTRDNEEAMIWRFSSKFRCK